MSVFVMTDVWRYADVNDAQAMLILVALADASNDEERIAKVSLPTLMHKGRCCRTTVKARLGDLEETGHITKVELGGQDGSSTPTAYRVNCQASMDHSTISDEHTFGGVATRPGSPHDPGHGVFDPPPDPLYIKEGFEGGSERLDEGSLQLGLGTTTASASVKPSGPIKYRGKKVKDGPWAMTLLVVEEFNDQVGKNLAALNQAGQPSEIGKRIYGQVLSWPDLAFEDYSRIIRNTLASRWWGDGPPSFGVVFGPKVFEENMERDGKADKVAPFTKGRYGTTDETRARWASRVQRSS